jgi:hypothetical protein
MAVGSNVYLLIPNALGDELLAPLRKHFADDPTVEVIVEKRTSERRAGIDNRILRDLDRRKGDERRAQTIPRGLPDLPAVAVPYADELRIIQRMTAVRPGLEDLPIEEIARLAVEGHPDAPTEIYWRSYERAYRRMAAHLNDQRAADKVMKRAFGFVFDRLASFDPVEDEFILWLDRAIDAFWLTIRDERL